MIGPRSKNALLVLLMLAPYACGQIFRVQGGTSTLLNAEGGSVEVKAPNYNGSMGIGFFNGKLEFGAETRYQFHGYTVLAGDDSVPFTLPTDIFDFSHYFSARGLGATRSDGERSLYAFAGATSSWLGTGFFTAAKTDSPVAIVFYQQKLSHHLNFVSRNILSNRQTMLQAVEWSPEKWLKASLTAGIGSNQHYFATGFDVKTEKVALKSGYVLTGDLFRRVTVASPMSSEVNKGNIEILYKPESFVSITAGHQNILEPLTLGGAMQQAAVDQLATDFHVEKFYFGVGLFASSSFGRGTEGTNFYVGRRIGQRFDVNTNYFASQPRSSQARSGAATTMLSATVRENLSSRFSLLELISRTAGQTTYALGGDFTSNRLFVRADYQNVYLPFRPDRPFEQALALNVGFRVHGPLQITAASNVAPDGHLRYSFGLSTYLYRLAGMTMNANSPDSFSIAKFVVQGMVKDDQGNPVEGAALHIGKEVVYSDSSGHFQVRFPRHGPYPLSVVPEEFITNGVFETVSAPHEVRAESEDSATDIAITLRHAVRPPAQVNHP
jgi:hypothetical protein